MVCTPDIGDVESWLVCLIILVSVQSTRMVFKTAMLLPWLVLLLLVANNNNNNNNNKHETLQQQR